MKEYYFSDKSEDKLKKCDHHLQSVAYLALKYSKYDFGITETLRTKERQEQLVSEGKSQTLNSRHLPSEYGFSEALDFVVYVDNEVTWDIKYYRAVAQAFFRAAIELGIQIEWGGLWETFVDGPHIQLRR